jgi:hypothetical protein
MAILTVDLELACMELMREWYWLFRTIPDVGKTVPEPKIAYKEEDGCNGTYNSPARLNPLVKLA